MIINKTAKNINGAFKPMYFFNSARDAFKQVLAEHKRQGGFTLFLPGYIGFSPNEGSGIFDPVCETGTTHKFYSVDKKLQIDVSAFERELENTKEKKIVLLVHYFGYPDNNFRKIAELCREHSAIIIEDAAHALYTDFIDHSCGNIGDYVIYSLHKMLPFAEGGMMKVNIPDDNIQFQTKVYDRYPVFNYDLYEISLTRKNNAKLWDELLENCRGILKLRKFSETVTPQTFPVIITDYNRNDLYFKLNEEGFGAVSLYHTMIEPIRNDGMEDAIWLSQHIMNLPVHQDVTPEKIKQMSKRIIEIIGG